MQREHGSKQIFVCAACAGRIPELTLFAAGDRVVQGPMQIDKLSYNDLVELMVSHGFTKHHVPGTGLAEEGRRARPMRLVGTAGPQPGAAVR